MILLSNKELENGNYLVTKIAQKTDGFHCLDYENRVYFQCVSRGETMKSLRIPKRSESIEW